MDFTNVPLVTKASIIFDVNREEQSKRASLWIWHSYKLQAVQLSVWSELKEKRIKSQMRKKTVYFYIKSVFYYNQVLCGSSGTSLPPEISATSFVRRKNSRFNYHFRWNCWVQLWNTDTEWHKISRFWILLNAGILL